MTSRRVLGLASAANEKAIRYRDAIDEPLGGDRDLHVLVYGLDLADAVDALNGAIVEEANQ